MDGGNGPTYGPRDGPTDGVTDRPTDRPTVATENYVIFIFVVIIFDATTHLYKRSCLSVRPSVHPSVRPSVHLSRVIYKQRIWPFEGKKSSSDIKSNDTMSNNEVVASDAPPRSFFFCTLLCTLWAQRAAPCPLSLHL